jgi:1-acyl-sn-glycerol-3-phosphate acyltransferase
MKSKRADKLDAFDLSRHLKFITEPLPMLPKMPRFVLRLLLLAFGHLVRIENEERLRAADPVIFAFNHNNSFEALIVPAYMMFLRKGKPISFLIDWMYAHIPPLGWLFKWIDPVYTYGKKARFAFFERSRKNCLGNFIVNECAERIEAGKSFGIFPEGKRNGNPQTLSKGRTGIGHIVIRTRVPVVPVGIVYPDARSNSVPSIGRIVLKAGEPIEFVEEIAALYSDVFTSSAARRDAERMLAGRIMRKVMENLSMLSGKTYQRDLPVAS